VLIKEEQYLENTQSKILQEKNEIINEKNRGVYTTHH
jgi:hypothetical protein